MAAKTVTAPTPTTDSLRFLTIAGTTYFGNYDPEKRVMTNAMQVSSGFSNTMIMDWLKKGNLGELNEASLGQGDSVVTVSLTKMQLFEVETLISRFAMAKAQALPMVENDAFSLLVGQGS